MIPITINAIRRSWKGVFFTGVGLMLIALMFAGLFEQMQNDIGSFTSMVPSGMEAFIGNLSDASTPEGWLGIELFALFFPIGISILGVVQGAKLIGQEEQSTTLELILSRPISRHRVIAEKALALLFLLMVTCLMLFSGVALGKVLFPFDVNLWHVLSALLCGLLLGLTFGLAAFATQAITGRRGVASAVGVAFIGGSYVLYIVSQLVESLENWKYASLFYYYDNPGVLTSGLHLENVLVFGVLIVLFYLIASIGFSRRDIGIA